MKSPEERDFKRSSPGRGEILPDRMSARKTFVLDSRSNGLSYLIDRMRGQPLFAHVDLAKGERSRLADLASDLL